MHIGRNISKIRELLGIKQEALALNLKISQQTISKIEQTARIRDTTIERIADALGVKTSTIINYSEDAILDFLHDKITINESCIDKLPETHQLLTKIIELYERLILAEREKFEQYVANCKSRPLKQ